MVAGEDENVVAIVSLYEVYVLVDSVCGSLVPVRAVLSLIRRKNSYAALYSVKIPRLAASYIFVQNKGLILCEHADCIYAGVDTV